MGKLFYQLAGLLLLFFGTWYLLSLIPFTSYHNFRELGKRNEQALAEFMLDYMRMDAYSIDSVEQKTDIALVVRRVCENSGIDCSELTLHFFRSSEVNAFALPARNMVVLTGLIGFCETPEELAGVMAHEIAHMEHNHVTKRLVKELGLSVVMSMISGHSGGNTAKGALRMLSSSAFDRSQEQKADETAVRILAHAGIDPIHLANFFGRLAEKEPSLSRSMAWVSTHPDSRERAESIKSIVKRYPFQVEPIMSPEQWCNLKETIGNL